MAGSVALKVMVPCRSSEPSRIAPVISFGLVHLSDIILGGADSARFACKSNASRPCDARAGRRRPVGCRRAASCGGWISAQRFCTAMTSQPAAIAPRALECRLTALGTRRRQRTHRLRRSRLRASGRRRRPSVTIRRGPRVTRRSGPAIASTTARSMRAGGSGRAPWMMRKPARSAACTAWTRERQPRTDPNRHQRAQRPVLSRRRHGADDRHAAAGGLPPCSSTSAASRSRSGRSPASARTQGFPDGMTVDADNHVWVAFWDGWCVRRLSPTGQIVS